MEAQSLTTCNQCGKKFQRKAHLLRHQQQHSGDRPYSCKFCSKTFKRSDVLRDHFSRCERRGSSAIPNSLDRGRKRHACDECSRLKVKCDNEVPCRKCKEFGRVCVKSRPVSAIQGEASPSSSGPELPVTSDRNSIGFLLNCPEETAFMREFPKSTTLSPRTNNDDVATPMPDLMPASNMSATQPAIYEEYNQLGNLDTMLSHLEFTKFEEETNNLQVRGSNVMRWHEPRTQYTQANFLEDRSLEIKQKLRLEAASQSSPDLPPKEVMDAIEIVTASNLFAWVALYFRHWHKHAPIVHQATFQTEIAALPLVMALMCLGGMYSKDPQEIATLKLLLDTVEGYIYSLPRFTANVDLPAQTYKDQVESTSAGWQKYQLEELQGAYLVIIVQSWMGNTVAKNRTRRQQLARIIAIFRAMGYLTAEHSPALIVKDEQSFMTWIRTECIARTVSYAAMLDNAFAIWHNISPRIQWSEIDLSFSGDSRYFSAANYNEVLQLSRPPEPVRKIKPAYLVLFSASESANEDLNFLRASNLTAMDMQMLIHFLYYHFWATTYGNPLAALPYTNFQHLLEPFYIATRNWKLVWNEIRAAAAEDEWNKLGFQRTAEMYYEAVLLLLRIYQKNGGRFPPIPGDCGKWDHIKLLLTFDPGSMLDGMDG